MRACTPWALSPHHTDTRCVGALDNPEVPTIAPSQRHGPRALGTPHESFLYPATQLINHIFSVTVAIRAAIKYDQDADGGWSGYRGEASTSSIRCPSSLSFHLMPLFSTGLPPFSSHEAVQFNQNALTYCQSPWAGTTMLQTCSIRQCFPGSDRTRRPCPRVRPYTSLCNNHCQENRRAWKNPSIVSTHPV